MSSRTPGLKLRRYDETAGKDTFAYVIDSGIHANHAVFGGAGCPRLQCRRPQR